MHTPGPWTAQPTARGAFGIWDGINRLVAETNSTASTHDRRPGSPSTPGAAEANARLIAQAPALLGWLEKAAQMAEQQCGDVWEDAPMHSAWLWLAEQARNAIKAARGQAPGG